MFVYLYSSTEEIFINYLLPTGADTYIISALTEMDKEPSLHGVFSLTGEDNSKQETKQILYAITKH